MDRNVNKSPIFHIPNIKNKFNYKDFLVPSPIYPNANNWSHLEMALNNLKESRTNIPLCNDNKGRYMACYEKISMYKFILKSYLSPSNIIENFPCFGRSVIIYY